LQQANLVNGVIFTVASIGYNGTHGISYGVSYNVRNATANTFQVGNTVTGNVESLANITNINLITNETSNLSYVQSLTLWNRGYGYLPGENVTAYVYGSVANANVTVTLQPDGNTVFKTVTHSGLGIVANSIMEGNAYVSPYK
jgi:hypothetical protein